MIETVEDHPADDEIDTSVFRNLADDFIDKTSTPSSSAPPVANFNETEVYKDLEATQRLVRQRLQNILLLIQPQTTATNE